MPLSFREAGSLHMLCDCRLVRNADYVQAFPTRPHGEIACQLENACGKTPVEIPTNGPLGWFCRFRSFYARRSYLKLVRIATKRQV